MKTLIGFSLWLFLVVGMVANAQEQKQEQEQQTQEQAQKPTEEEAQKPTEGQEGTTEPIPDGQGVQWSEMFKAWSTTHYLHIDFTHPETGEWCAVLVIDNRTQQAQCIK